jgi:hypothetical protein
MNDPAFHQPHRHIKPLQERVASSTWSRAVEMDLGVTLPSSKSKSVLLWPAPIFSRLGLDFDLSPAMKTALASAHSQSGLTIYGPWKIDPEVPLSTDLRSLAAGVTIAPVFVDEPFVPELFAHTEQIEWQFIPCRSSPLRTETASAWGVQKKDWKAILPSDLARVDSFSARIEMMRLWNDQPAAVIGGAIGAGAVYEDVRFLADAGLDYAHLLCDGRFGELANQFHRLGNVDTVLDQANRAIHDSGRSDFALAISASGCSPESVWKWLGAGVRAINIDSFILGQQPVTETPASDTFGSFLGDYRRPAHSATEWLNSAVRDMLESLASELAYTGHQRLSEWLNREGLAAPAPVPLTKKKSGTNPKNP